MTAATTVSETNSKAALTSITPVSTQAVKNGTIPVQRRLDTTLRALFQTSPTSWVLWSGWIIMT